MFQSYSDQLRGDSAIAVVPVTAILTLLGSLFAVAMITPDKPLVYWSLWLAMAASPITAFYVSKLLRRERQRQAGALFVGVHILLVTLVLYHLWSPGSVVPYLYGLFIVASGMLIDVTASFVTWLVSTLLYLAVMSLLGQLSWSNGGVLSGPVLVNLGLAIISFLGAIDWKMALESVSELQRKAQERRDELFQMKEELSLTNAKLFHLNIELDKARQAAVDERDMRTRFMNNVSHELRTPLNSIVNFAYILSRGGRGEVNAEQVDYLQRMERAGNHLLTVLNDLLDMARIESGEFTLQCEVTELSELCEEAMASTRGLILDKEGEVELVREYPQQWPLVRIDKMRMKQALINLLGNAAKYTDQGYIALRVRPNGESVHIVVEDTGMGIAPEHHELVFQEFRQVQSTAARRRMGTGLGLPITRHLVERHGGTVTLESELGRGSLFTITLPTYRDEARPQNGSAPPEIAITAEPVAAVA
jgi:signal transduction histidine kinase